MDQSTRTRSDRPTDQELRSFRVLANALGAEACVLDGLGRILLVNRAWTDVAGKGSGGDASEGAWLGQDYLEVCRSATGPSSEGATIAAEGIDRVLAGETRRVSVVYPCDFDGVAHWFEFTANAIDHPSARVLVTHSDVTERERYRRDAEARFGSLTARELEILGRIMGGATSKRIAADLGIAPNTVENHRASILKKSRATNTAELVRLGVSAQLGVIEDPDDPE